MRRLLALAAALTSLALPAAALADAPPPGSKWSQAYITEADGTKLHADVLRPAGLPADARTPVILTIGPYFNHSGQTGPLGPAEDTPYTPVGDAGPSARFYDFINGAKVFERGYTWVQVDLRGFGGSSGCLDWAGPGEQADVKAAVEWAAAQPWSTGKVGMYGKSYDGVTGLLGIAQQPQGLAAVVSQEPVYDLYRYLYSNRVRFVNSLATPLLYDAIAGTPGTSGDELAYQQGALDDTARPGCPALNWLDQQQREHDASYWRPRDLIAKTRGKTTPLFLTQGFIEDNTKPDGTWDLYNGLAGPKRAWFGMWDHVRGNDTDENGRLKMGRAGWFDEVMRFYDRHVKGAAAADDPPNAVESSDGTWRSEAAWPPADSERVTRQLRTGSYQDDATNNGTAERRLVQREGLLDDLADPRRRRAPGRRAARDRGRRAGDPGREPRRRRLRHRRRAQRDPDLARRLPATRSRAGHVRPLRRRLEAAGRPSPRRARHRRQRGVVAARADRAGRGGASIELPFLRCRRTATIQGDPSLKLESYREGAPFALPAATVTQATDAGLTVPGVQDCAS